MTQFGERLKSARTMAGLSLQDLAEKLQNRVTRQALHKYEKGEIMPDSEMVGLLCEARTSAFGLFLSKSRGEP